VTGLTERMPSSSGLKMEALWSFETSVSLYKSLRSYYPEDNNRYLHCRENLKCHRKYAIFKNTFSAAREGTVEV
jgi:lysylphosphatidylglycerol synthetase-like protein (DUF2156 family)